MTCCCVSENMWGGEPKNRICFDEIDAESVDLKQAPYFWDKPKNIHW